MSTFDDICGFAKPAHGDSSWTTEINFNWDELGMLFGPDNSYFVSPLFTTGNLFQDGAPSDRRHFPTIQEAITAAEGSGTSDRATIRIAPGAYPENLVFAGSITLASLVPPLWDGQGGGLSVLIHGTTTAASSLFTINPIGGTTHTAVNLIGVCCINSYSQSNAVEITNPYLVDITKPASYTTGKCYFAMRHCQTKMQTYGVDNLWTYGIKADGYASVVLRDCDFTSLKYAGGSNNGGIRNLFYLRGDSTNGKNMGFGAKNVNVSATYGGSGAPVVFNIDDGVTGKIGYSSLPSTSTHLLLSTGATGTNQIDGLTGDSLVEYYNTQGISFSWF